MQANQERPPAYVVDHDSRSLVLPSVPTHDLPLHRPQNGQTSHIVLPDIKSLGLPTGRPSAIHPAQQYASTWTTIQPPSTYPHSATVSPRSYSSVMLPPPSPMEAETIMSDGRTFRSMSIMSYEDAETREAAETLSGLRNIDYKRSSSAHSSNATTLHSITQDEGSIHSMEITMDEDEEPLLSLITESHPWIGGTINTSLYAYNSTMHYTPAFIASLIEKNVSSVANGLGTVGRKTGVQNRVRQYFGDTPERRSARESARTSHKRPRQPSIEYDDLERGFLPSPQSRQRSRTGSQVSYTDTLPAYDEKSAPSYERSSNASPSQQTWKAKWMITTSGLGVALSDASLRSLKFCLSLLRQASGHLTEVMMALRSLLEEYNQAISGAQAPGQSSCNLTPEQEAASQAIAEKIKNLGADIVNILQTVTSNVSRYTGGALPENAGALVRRQLLSIPQRWQVAQQQTQSDGGSLPGAGSEATRTGQRWIVFAEQGLDMITQVNIVLHGTVDSAEQWLDSMGRKRRASASSSASMLDYKTRSGLMSPPMTIHETQVKPHHGYEMHMGTKL